MASAFELTTFGTAASPHSIGPATVYNFMLSDQDDIVVEGELALTQRMSAGPLVSGTSSPGRVIVIRSDGPDNDDAAAVAYRQNIDAWFSPLLNAVGPRYLERYADDGTTLIQIPCYVTAKTFTGRGANAYTIVLFSPQQEWIASSATTSNNNPATVTNAGSIAVAPIITLTTTTHITHRACTVADTSGRGLSAYPVMFDLSDANATTTNTLVFVEGKLVSSWLDNSGAADSRVWCLVDAAADLSTTAVDILYGTGLTNPLGQTFIETSIDFSSASNSQWRGGTSNWNVMAYPEHAGVWRPAKTGNHNPAADNSYAMTTSGSTVVFTNAVADTYPPNGYDSLVMSLGGAQMGTTDALTIRRILANFDATPNARAFVRTRTAGSADWTDKWTSSTNATVTTAVDVDNAVEIAIGFENHGATADPLTFTVGGAAPILDIISTPTVVVGTAANYDHYDGTYTIGAYVLTFNDLLVPDGTLTLDCGAKDASSSAAGRFFWIGDAMLSHSDPFDWILIVPGSNTVTDGLTAATDVVSFRGGFGA